MKLIVGLGNPGKEYEHTRHNVGFLVLDKLLDKINWVKKNDAQIFETKYKREKIIYLKPLLYMNLSGIAVAKYLKYYKINLENVLVIHDDVDIEIGNLKFKTKGSSGGHNGVQSIIDNLSSTNFNRLKIGVSKNNLIDTKDYVLGKFSQSEKKIIENKLPEIFETINKFLNNGYK